MAPALMQELYTLQVQETMGSPLPTARQRHHRRSPPNSVPDPQPSSLPSPFPLCALSLPSTGVRGREQRGPVCDALPPEGDSQSDRSWRLSAQASGDRRLSAPRWWCPPVWGRAMCLRPPSQSRTSTTSHATYWPQGPRTSMMCPLSGGCFPASMAKR